MEQAQKSVRKSPLHSVTERDGGYVVTMPSAVSQARRAVVGVEEQIFSSRNEAEEAIMRSKEDLRIHFELQDLRKTCTPHFYRLERGARGGFRVVAPAFRSLDGRYTLGTTTTEFAEWDDAKAFYLAERQQQERLVDHPILDLALSDRERVAFSDWQGFHPEVAPGTQVVEIPPHLKQLLFTPDRMNGGPSAYSYRKTIEQEHWQKEILQVVQTYLETKGSPLLTELNITHLDQLTPKQAIDLSTRIVMDLTKYYTQKTSYLDLSTGRAIPIAHDAVSVPQILQEGMMHRDDPHWEGNGVCRTFASTLKGVYEALKSHQGAFTQLANTYCLCEEDDTSFQPTRKDPNIFSDAGADGHAWNTFVTLNAEGAAHAVVADVTWAKRDLQTKKIQYLDHTLLRMEPYVSASMQLARSAKMEPNVLATEQDRALQYYVFQLETLSTSSIVQDRAHVPFFASRCVELLQDADMKRELSHVALKAIEREYIMLGDRMDPSEIDALWRLYQRQPSFQFTAILKGYTGDHTSIRRHLFRDNDLQRFAFEAESDRAVAMARLQGSPEYRARIREVIPSLFASFDPTASQEDAAELTYLLRSEPVLERLAMRAQSPWEPDSAAKIYAYVREILRQGNPDYYAAHVATMRDYDLIKNFRTIRRASRLATSV